MFLQSILGFCVLLAIFAAASSLLAITLYFISRHTYDPLTHEVYVDNKTKERRARLVR